MQPFLSWDLNKTHTKRKLKAKPQGKYCVVSNIILYKNAETAF